MDRTNNTIHLLFDDVAELFESFSGTLDSIENPMREWLTNNLKGGQRALDIGCGAGRYSLLLTEFYSEVTGADPAPTMIEIARRDRAHPNVRYLERDAFDITPEKDGNFDLVFAFSCVFHMAKPDVILPHLSRLVSSGGQLIIFEPERPPYWGSANWRTDYAFQIARMIYDTSQDVELSCNALRAFTHKSWHRITEHSVPLNQDEFQREYSTALPTVQLSQHVFPGFLTAIWERPAAGGT